MGNREGEKKDFKELERRRYAAADADQIEQRDQQCE
jgi:hypothetical protein